MESLKCQFESREIGRIVRRQTRAPKGARMRWMSRSSGRTRASMDSRMPTRATRFVFYHEKEDWILEAARWS